MEKDICQKKLLFFSKQPSKKKRADKKMKYVYTFWSTKKKKASAKNIEYRPLPTKGGHLG